MGAIAVVIVHAVGGASLVAIGALALRAPKRRDGAHGRLGRVFFWILVPTMSLGLALGARTPGVSAFEAQTAPALLAGTGAYVAARRRRSWLGASWLFWHIGGQLTAYAAIVAATLNQTVGRELPRSPAVVAALTAVPALVAFVGGVRAMAARGLLSAPAARPRRADR